MPLIEVTLKNCTIYKNIPYGLANIFYSVEGKKYESFRGICFFSEGKLHMGPFTCMDGNGFVRSFSRMHNGRPADSHYMTQFFPRVYERNIHSLNSLVNVEGMHM
jgi:hypothetical protein